MARNESDREDMMDEAVSLVPRIEFRYPSNPEPALIGINRFDWLFVYRDPDTMYRFDEQNRLRRAFVEGTLYRTTGQTLAALVRSRSGSSNGTDGPAQSLLLRQDLSPDELSSFRERMRTHLVELSNGLQVGTVLRLHPAEMKGFPDQIQQRFQQILTATDFLAPAIVRR